jgi:hypothetical protein
MKKRFLERLYSNDFPDRKDVVCIDVLPINKDQLIKVALISTNAPRMQGAMFSITAGTGYIEYMGNRSRGIGLWWGTTPREVIVKCHSVPKLLTIYNGYRDNLNHPRTLMYKTGMLVEEKDNKRIYRCNDVNDGDNRFDKLVFSVEKL